MISWKIVKNCNSKTFIMIENSLISNTSIWGILIRFGINLVFLIILIGVVYYRYSKKEKFLFTFFLIGIIVFFVSSIMKKFDIGVGMAFGLFAIFGILRLRTINFSVKDMAYLFACIGISVINALGLLIYHFYGILIFNTLIILTALILELFIKSKIFKRESIVYENINLLRPENQDSLIQDISARTGQEILKTKVRDINFKRGIAKLDIYFKEKDNKKKNEIQKPEVPEKPLQQSEDNKQ